MLPGLRLGFLSLCLALGAFSPMWAENTPPEKPVAKAASKQSASAATIPHHNRVVALLLESFNGNTNVEALSAALQASQQPTPTAMMAPDSEMAY